MRQKWKGKQLLEIKPRTPGLRFGCSGELWQPNNHQPPQLGCYNICTDHCPIHWLAYRGFERGRRLHGSTFSHSSTHPQLCAWAWYLLIILYLVLPQYSLYPILHSHLSWPAFPGASYSILLRIADAHLDTYAQRKTLSLHVSCAMRAWSMTW